VAIGVRGNDVRGKEQVPVGIMPSNGSGTIGREAFGKGNEKNNRRGKEKGGKRFVRLKDLFPCETPHGRSLRSLLTFRNTLNAALLERKKGIGKRIPDDQGFQFPVQSDARRFAGRTGTLSQGEPWSKRGT